MNLKIKKITRITAIGIFFMALFFNVKINLEGPFVGVDNAAMAQASIPENGEDCWDTITEKAGVFTRYCGTCEVTENSEPSFWSNLKKCTE